MVFPPFPALSGRCWCLHMPCRNPAGSVADRLLLPESIKPSTSTSSAFRLIAGSFTVSCWDHRRNRSPGTRRSGFACQ